MSERQISNFRKGAYTDEEMKIAVALGRLHVPYLQQVEFSTGRAIPKNGLTLTYKVDFKVGEHLIVEITGEGTSSDDPEKHNFFTKEMGFKIIYISNESVIASPSTIAQYIKDEWILSLLRETAKS